MQNSVCFCKWAYYGVRRNIALDAMLAQHSYTYVRIRIYICVTNATHKALYTILYYAMLCYAALCYHYTVTHSRS
jgi:hypothetical protein